MRGGIKKFAKRNINVLEIVKTVIEIYRIILWRKLLATITVEGDQLIEGKTENLETLKRKSVTYIRLKPLHSIKIGRILGITFSLSIQIRSIQVHLQWRRIKEGIL